MSSPAPGFYDDGHGVRRWWNGQDWTGHTEPKATDPAQAAIQVGSLNAEVARFVAAGYTVELNDGQQAVVTKQGHMSVPLNLLGVLLTGGLWLIVILIRLGSPHIERRVLRVGADGVVKGR